MLFNSYAFIFAFLPIALTGFSLISRWGGMRGAVFWLVACSLFFYGWWNPLFLPVLIISMVANFLVSSMLRESTPLKLSKRARHLILVIGIAGNLAAIAYFKYAGFFSEILLAASGISTGLEGIVLPLAISFFTFQQITYLVDTHRGEATASNFLDYCLFVTFFPQLIAGPIVHHKEMMPQFLSLKANHAITSNLSIGMTVFVIGLFKKVLLADTVASYSTPVFNLVEGGTQVDFFLAWRAALSYTMQIYFDFSGYSDMAIGLARMFGIHLPLNFNSPYKSLSIIEFWRRWHMTLSRFLRDYVYISLGGNRKGRERRYVNLFTTMLLGGLWHGAGWTFIFWGALHGFYLMVNHGWHAFTRSIGREHILENLTGKFISYILTMLAVVIGWVFFRAESLEAALSILSSMAGFNGFVVPAAFEGLFGWGRELMSISFGYGGGAEFTIAWSLIALLFLIVVLLPNSQEIVQDSFFLEPENEKISKYAVVGPMFFSRLRWKSEPACAMIIGLALAGSIMSLYSVSEFLYFQF